LTAEYARRDRKAGDEKQQQFCDLCFGIFAVVLRKLCG